MGCLGLVLGTVVGVLSGKLVDLICTGVIAGSFKSQLIDYFRGAITSWELVEGSLWQFYDNET